MNHKVTVTGRSVAMNGVGAILRICVCGIGPIDAAPARCAWVNERRKSQVYNVPKLNKHEAEWFALAAALRHVRSGRSVEIICSSPLVVAQFNEKSPLTGRRTACLFARAYQHIRNRALKVTCTWLPRSNNWAAKRLRATITRLSPAADAGADHIMKNGVSDGDCRIGGKRREGGSVSTGEAVESDDFKGPTKKHPTSELDRAAAWIPNRDLRVIYIAALPPYFAWLCETTGAKRVGRSDGCTATQLVYLGVLSALKEVPKHFDVTVHSTSIPFLGQFNEWQDARRPSDPALLRQLRGLISRRHLPVTAVGVRGKNPASRLLPNQSREEPK